MVFESVFDLSREVFEENDKRKQGFLDRDGFFNALTKICEISQIQKVSRPHSNLMMNKFKSARKEEISFKEFRSFTAELFNVKT